jgi:hypothetical protein
MSEVMVYATNETNSENTDGVCTVLYFTEKVDRATVQEWLRHVAANRSKFRSASLVTNPDDEYFGYQELPTVVSDRAGLFRYECYGSA